MVFAELTPSRQEELSRLMTEVVGSLRWGTTQIRARIAVSNIADLIAYGTVVGAPILLFTSTNDARSAALSAVKTFETIIDRLDKASRAEVLVEQTPIEKWMAGAEAVREGIAQAAQVLKDDSTARGIDAQWQNFEDEAARLGEKAKNRLAWGFGAVAAGLVGIGVLWAVSRR